MKVINDTQFFYKSIFLNLVEYLQILRQNAQIFNEMSIKLYKLCILEDPARPIGRKVET